MSVPYHVHFAGTFKSMPRRALLGTVLSPLGRTGDRTQADKPAQMHIGPDRRGHKITDNAPPPPWVSRELVPLPGDPEERMQSDSTFSHREAQSMDSATRSITQRSDFHD